jgi:hypothetical protein
MPETKREADGMGDSALGAYQVVSKEERQRKRLFQRLITGLYFHRKEQIRFITLTSGQHSPDTLRDSWKEIVKRIRRTTPASLALAGYVPGQDINKWKTFCEPLKFEYLAVFTNEGRGVVHVVAAGDYIPFQWLQDNWSDIHSAYGVNIKKVRPYIRRKNRKGYRRAAPRTGDMVYFPPGLASYLLTQYVRNQSAIRWVQHSRGWVYPGFVKDWTRLKRWHKNEPLAEKIQRWHKFLDDYREPQADLAGRIVPPSIRNY